MDTQLNNYEVLKNGKSVGVIGTLEMVIHVIRNLESMIDRATQHSPYTIGRRDFKNGS